MERTEADRLRDLVKRLVSQPSESGWLEFKVNQSDPEEIGQYASALSNGAALAGQPFGYLVWGVEDKGHAIVGTTFDPDTAKTGNEDLFPWLSRTVDPDVEIRFMTLDVEGVRLAILRVRAAVIRPTRFKRQAYVRVGSYKKPLDSHPELEARLWHIMQSTSFEKEVVKVDCSPEEVLSAIDYRAYFELLNVPEPASTPEILDCLAQEGIIVRDDADRWEITAMGALLFARSLGTFDSLTRKQLRVVHYVGPSRVQSRGEVVFHAGYAKAFSEAVHYLHQVLPTNEVLKEALRADVPMFPAVALRELLANALIHQDFAARGQGPMVEIFDTRLEFANPGSPLVDSLRLLDSPPKSRNESLAAFMRRLGICEERGSGWDKVAAEIDFNQLPAPLVETVDNNMRVTLYGHKRLTDMDTDERTRAVYLHACLRYVTGQHTNNTSVRERFDISQSNAAMATRLLTDTVSAGLIKLYDPSAGRKHARYVPFWAGSLAESL